MQTEEYCRELEMANYNCVTKIRLLTREVERLRTREKLIDDLRIHLEDVEVRLTKASKDLCHSEKKRPAFQAQVSHAVLKVE